MTVSNIYGKQRRISANQFIIILIVNNLLEHMSYVQMVGEDKRNLFWQLPNQEIQNKLKLMSATIAGGIFTHAINMQP